MRASRRASVLLADPDPPAWVLEALEAAPVECHRSAEDVEGDQVECVVRSYDPEEGWSGASSPVDVHDLSEPATTHPPVVATVADALDADGLEAVTEHASACVIERADGSHRERLRTAIVREVEAQHERRERTRDLERDREMLTSLLEHVPMSIYFKDRQSRHERVSHHMLCSDPDSFITNQEGKAHCHPEDIHGKTDFDLYAPEFAAEAVADDREIMDAEVPLVDDLAASTTSLGEPIFTSTTKAPRYDEDGNVIGLVGVTMDVTDRELHKRELERQNDRLNEFTEVLTHDLRSPLTVVSGYLSLLADRYDDDAIDECTGAIDRMDRLIEEVRAFVLEGRTVESPTPIDVADVARSAWRSVAAGEATLEVATDLRVVADRDRVVRVFENLYRNAVEYAGSDVTVTVGALEDERGFFVADDGPGIDPAVRERVFDRGYTTGEGSTGFGLAIVENIAEAHDWSVAVTDSDAGGARFEFAGVVEADRPVESKG